MPKKNRKRKTIDIEPGIEESLKELSEELGVPMAQLRNLFTAEGIIDVQDGQGSIWSRFRRSKSNYYKSNLDMDDLLDLLDKRRK